MILEANVANRACFVTLTLICQVFLCILSVILYTRVLYVIGLLLYDVQQAWTQHNKHAVLPKKIVILHPNLPITATSPQQALSFCPQDGHCEEIQQYIYNNFFSVEIIH